MATELRWILAILSVPLLLGIWWWTARRSRQAPGNAEMRESMMGSAPDPGRIAVPMDDESGWTDSRVYDSTSRDWGVPPLEPLSIRTADFEQMPLVDLPMMAHTDPLEETMDLGVAECELAASKFVTAPLEAVDAQEVDAPAAPAPAATMAPPPAASQSVNASEAQRIITVRVCALGESRWNGLDLAAALESHGLAYGRYQVFHRVHSDGRTLFCAASLIEPGTFNRASMPDEEYRGVTLFAILPGPLDPLHTLNALIETAGKLAQTLGGMVQDSKGIALSTQRAEALREDVMRFRASLTPA